MRAPIPESKQETGNGCGGRFQNPQAIPPVLPTQFHQLGTKSVLKCLSYERPHSSDQRHYCDIWFKNNEARENTLPEVSWLLSPKLDKELDHVGEDGELSDL